MTQARTLTCDAVRDLAPLFVTGALDAAEADAVRAHLATCDDAHAELLELGEAATALLETIEPVEPPARLRTSLLAAAAADLEAGRHPSTAGGQVSTTASPVAAPVGTPAPEPGPAPAPAPRLAPVTDLASARGGRRSRLGWVLAAAAVIVALVLGGSNLALRRDLDAVQAYRDGVAAALDLAAQPGSSTALLASENGSVSGIGVVGADGTVRLAMRGLAPTSGSHVYTAWTIAGGGAPVPIGDFTVGADGTAVAVATTPSTGATGELVLALTLEPATGATTPTLPIVASGATRAPAG